MHSCRAWRSSERGEKERRRRSRRRSWSSVEAQGLRSRCQVLTEKVQTLCFLQFVAIFELVQAKSPQGRPARIALEFLSAESSSCLLAKAVETDWILWRLLRKSQTFWRVLLEESEDLTEGLREDRVREVLQKNSKSLPFPYFNVFFFFFFQKIDERLNEIRRKLRSCTSRSIDFTHEKLKTRTTPFTMYGKECSAAWPNPGLWPFAGRPPVKSKCMGFAGYFARWSSNIAVRCPSQVNGWKAQIFQQYCQVKNFRPVPIFVHLTWNWFVQKMFVLSRASKWNDFEIQGPQSKEKFQHHI